jgi:hypothetical protein
VSDDRHAEHRRVDPERYGPSPLSRPPLSQTGRRVLVTAGVVVAVAVVLVVLLLVTR